jgi:tetratricopeptide (TPR) repeat protein
MYSASGDRRRTLLQSSPRKYPGLGEFRRLAPVCAMTLVKKLGLLTAFLAGHSLALAQTQEDPTVSIGTALRAREFDKAVELTRSALRASPGSAQLWTLQGIAFAGKGDSKPALAAFQQALKISPNSVAALAGAAQIEYEADSREAVPLLNRLLELRPGDPTGHAMLAVLEYRKGDCPAAVPHFDKAGKLLDSQLDALHAYATCLAKLKRLDEAATVLQRALALRPDDPQERHLLAAMQIMGQKPRTPSRRCGLFSTPGIRPRLRYSSLPTRLKTRATRRWP